MEARTANHSKPITPKSANLMNDSASIYTNPHVPKTREPHVIKIDLDPSAKNRSKDISNISLQPTHKLRDLGPT